MYTIRLVDPRRERMLWGVVAAGQRAWEARHGASSVLDGFDPFSGHVFAVAFLDRDGIPVAGARIHVRAAGSPLPIERHFAHNALLSSELARRQEAGVGEVSGLWAAEELAGTGIDAAAVATAAAHAPIVGVRHLVAFVHQRHRVNEAAGFHLDGRFGEHPYPDSSHRSVVRWCDTRTLEGADRAVRLAVVLQRRQLARREQIRFHRRVATWARVPEAVGA